MPPLQPDAIKLLVVHCSDTPDDQPLRAIDIQDMHLGFGWDGVGYHYVIGRDGLCEAGRPEYWQGAHVKGVNDHSLGVCLIGRNSFTDAQMHSLEALLRRWQSKYPGAIVLGHRDAVETHKTCPNFDVGKWWQERTGKAGEQYLTIIATTAPLYNTPSADAGLDTEILFGERARILDLAPGYYKVRLDTDGYEGWIKQDTATGYDHAPNARIAVASVHVTSEQDVKSPALLRLSLGSLVRVEASNADWHRLNLPGGRTGFIPALACCDLSHCANDYISAAENLVGVPYLWGGRSASGIDCSALVQLSLQTAGIACPRDSGPQREWARQHGTSVKMGEEMQRGDLLFWPGHVAICQSATHILHANAHHHAVASEAISLALPRLATATGSEADIFRFTGE